LNNKEIIFFYKTISCSLKKGERMSGQNSRLVSLSDELQVPAKNKNEAALQSWIDTVSVILGVCLAPEKAEHPLDGVAEEERKNIKKQLLMSIPTRKGEDTSQKTHVFVNKVEMYLRCVSYTEQAKIMFIATKMTSKRRFDGAL
jgi:hypothetical protein